MRKIDRNCAVLAGEGIGEHVLYLNQSKRLWAYKAEDYKREAKDILKFLESYLPGGTFDELAKEMRKHA